MRPPALVLGAVAMFGSALGCARKDDPPGEASPAPLAPRPVVPDRIEGTLVLDGKPLAIVKCRPGHQDTVYVDMVTAAGALRFVSGESARMYWNPRPDANERGTPIECSIPHRSWGGARREDGTAYFRGELKFTCRGPSGELAGDVSLECGNITPLERTLLDDGRRRRRDANSPKAP